MHGAQRVVVFCLMVAVLPAALLMLCLYLRHRAFADVRYPVAESDILEMINSASSVFCEEHILKMDTPFNAYQAKGKPEMSKTVKKHVRLHKSMSLPDDTLEYWGFFLPSSSTVLLTVCSRYDGSRILVVKGEKNLRDCGLMQPTHQTGAVHHAEGQGNIVVQHDDVLKQPHTTDRTTTQSEDAAVEAPAFKLDGGIAHGGNARNYTEKLNETSVSSFESTLLTCYDGQILLSESFDPSRQCNSTKFLESGSHLRTVHDVVSDGYYYYIFYSDNDYVLNDIHAIFDIHKPTYQFGNYTRGCINETECRFPVKFWSDEIVVVEVPTRDGIENEHEDITILTSVCIPRSAVYSIFPILILLCILVCAFI
ncbi:unnamed protein product [Nesidiocoris tenuis]|uniref:E3 ubiquitin-protein ligase APD1-4 middle domain-containing protein n=1 Tax=Nesidiocoris tenuis TaxID=355587 RepID=A0A6H5HIW3_9HEMI|nr:unnamed protein product [Nesidiocoris tenuis]CAB0018056.1 unnamed protein product [Nesidiocoris tenuis]